MSGLHFILILLINQIITYVLTFWWSLITSQLYLVTCRGEHENTAVLVRCVYILHVLKYKVLIGNMTHKL